MPPRLSLPSIAQQCRALFSQPAATSRPLSTTTPLRAGTSSSTDSFTSRLHGVGDDKASSSSSSRSHPRRSGGGGGGRKSGGGIDELQAMLARQESREAYSRTKQTAQKNNASTLRDQAVSDAYLRQFPRRWSTGEVYAPHDLSPEELKEFRKPVKPKFDVFDVLGFNPLDNYSNFSVISEYMTPHGRIKHQTKTALRQPNHRKIAKAIRRAIGLGLHPSVHRHPEIIHRLQKRFSEQTASMRRPQ